MAGSRKREHKQVGILTLSSSNFSDKYTKYVTPKKTRRNEIADVNFRRGELTGTSSSLAFSNKIRQKYDSYTKPARLLPSLLFLRLSGGEKREKISIINVIHNYIRHYLHLSLTINTPLKQTSDHHESWYNVLLCAKPMPKQDFSIHSKPGKPGTYTIIPHSISVVLNHERLSSEFVYPQLKSQICPAAQPEQAKNIATLQHITYFQAHDRSDSNRSIHPQLTGNHALTLSHVTTQEVPLPDTGKLLKTTDKPINREKQTGKGVRRNVYGERGYPETGIFIPGFTKTSNFSSDVFQKQTAGNYLRIGKRHRVTDRIAKIQHIKNLVLQSELPVEKLKSQILPAMTTLPEQGKKIAILQFITHFQEHSDSNRTIHPGLGNHNLKLSHEKRSEVLLPDTRKVFETTDKPIIRETKKQTGNVDRRNVYGKRAYTETGMVIPCFTKTSNFSSDVLQTAGNYLRIVKRNNLTDRIAETQHTKGRALPGELPCEKLKSPILPARATLTEQGNNIAILQFITHFQEHSDSNRTIHPRLTKNLELSHLRTSEVPLHETRTVRNTTDNSIIRETNKQTGKGGRRNVYGEQGSSETGILTPGLAKISNFSSDVFHKQTAGNYLRIGKRHSLTDRIAETQHTKGQALPGEIPYEKLTSQTLPAKTTDNSIIRESKKQTGKSERWNVSGKQTDPETGILIPGLTKISNFSSDVFQKQTAGNYLRIIKRDRVTDRIAETQNIKERVLQNEIPYEKLKLPIPPARIMLPQQGNRIRTFQFITHFQEHSDSNRIIHPRLTGNLNFSHIKTLDVPLDETRTVHKTTDNSIIRETKKQTGKGVRWHVYGERVYSERGILIPGFTKTTNFSSDVFQKQTAGNYLKIVKRDSLTDRIAQTQHTEGRALPREIPFENLRSQIRPAMTTLPEQGNTIAILQSTTHFQEHSDSNRTIHPRLTGNLELSHIMSEVLLPDTRTVHKTTDNSIITETKKQTGNVDRRNVYGKRGYSETGILIPGLTKTNNFSSDVFQKQTAANYLRMVKRDRVTDRIAQTQHTKVRALQNEIPYDTLRSQILPALTTLPEQGNTISILQFVTHLQKHSDSNRTIHPLLTGNLELSHLKTSEVPLPDTRKVFKTTDFSLIRETKKQTGKGDRRNGFREQAYSETGILIPDFAKTTNFPSDAFRKQTTGNYLRMVKRDRGTDRIAQIQHTKGQALPREISYEKLKSQIPPALTTLPEQGNTISIIRFFTHLQEHSDSNSVMYPRFNRKLEFSHVISDVPLPETRTVRHTTDKIREMKKLTGKGDRRDVYGERGYSDAGILIPDFAKTNNFSADVFQKQIAGNYLRIVKRGSLTDRIAQTQHTKGKALQSEIPSELRPPIRPAMTTLPEQGNTISIFQFITHLQEHSDSNRPIYPRLNGNLVFSHILPDVPLSDTGQVKTTDNSTIRETKRQTGSVFGERRYAKTGILSPDVTKTSNFSSDVFHKQTAGNYLKIVRRDGLTDRMAETQHTKGRARKREMPEIPVEKIVPMKDVTLQYAGVRRNDLLSTVKNSVSNRNKTPDLVLKKPGMYSDDKTAEQGRKNIFTHTDEIPSPRNMHVTGSFHELNNIADKVYKLIETKISTEKERRGIG